MGATVSAPDGVDILVALADFLVEEQALIDHIFGLVFELLYFGEHVVVVVDVVLGYLAQFFYVSLHPFYLLAVLL